MFRRTVVALIMGCALAAASPSPGTAAAPARAPQQTMPSLLAPGRDGVWFAELHAFRDGRMEQWVARITPQGVVTRFRARLEWDPSLPVPRGVDASLMDVEVSPDGAVWYAGGSGMIGRIDPSGRNSRFPMGPDAVARGGGVDSLAAAGDGSVWFTGTRVGHLLPTGAAAAVARPDRESAYGIVTGPSGDLWFVDSVNGPGGWVQHIARMTAAGAVTRFRALTGRTLIGEIEDLTAGPDGNVWFTHRRRIGRITPEGRVTRFPARIPGDAELESLAAGPDGALWFTAVPGDLDAGPLPIGRMTTAGVVSEFPPAPRVTRVTRGGAAGAVVLLRCPAAVRPHSNFTGTLGGELSFPVVLRTVRRS